MSVRTRLRLTDPDACEATLTITMTVGEWRKLKTQLETDYPAWHISQAIMHLVERATSVVDEEVEA